MDAVRRCAASSNSCLIAVAFEAELFRDGGEISSSSVDDNRDATEAFAGTCATGMSCLPSGPSKVSSTSSPFSSMIALFSGSRLGSDRGKLESISRRGLLRTLSGNENHVQSLGKAANTQNICLQATSLWQYHLRRVEQTAGANTKMYMSGDGCA